MNGSAKQKTNLGGFIVSQVAVLALPLLVGNSCLRQAIAPDAGDTTTVLVDTYRGYGPRECPSYCSAVGGYGGRAKVDIAVASRDGEPINCLRLTYDVGSREGQGTPNAHAMMHDLELPGSVRSLRVRFLGDNSGNRLALTVVDSSGERLLYYVADLTSDEWCVGEVEMGAPDANWLGNGDQRLDYPLQLRAVDVHVGAAAQALYGEVYIDAVEAVCEVPQGMVQPLLDEDGQIGVGWETDGDAFEHAAVSSTPSPDDAAVPAAKLAYRLSPPDHDTDPFISFVPPAAATVDAPGMLLADVYGDATRNRLQFAAVDSDGNEWRAPHPPVLLDWTGWRTVYAFTGGATWQRVADVDQAGGGMYPIRLKALVVTPGGPWFNDSVLEGELLVRQLRFVYATPQTSMTCRQELTDARERPPPR